MTRISDILRKGVIIFSASISKRGSKPSLRSGFSNISSVISASIWVMDLICNCSNKELWRLFDFEKTANGCLLTRYLRKGDPGITELEIPSKFRSLTVRGISSNAFEDAVYLRTVVVPETVLAMGSAAFMGCGALSEISLPEHLRLIDHAAFRNCGSLRRVVVPDSVEIVRTNAFQGCGALEEVVLPESGCILYSGSFRDCPSLRSIVFPEKDRVTLLGSAFEGCPLLPAETRMYALIGLNDLDKPFVYGVRFDWKTALREDVFRLAVRHRSFVNVGNETLFKHIIDDGLIGLLPIAAEILDDRLAGELVVYSAERGKTEITAWLLNFKKPPEATIEQMINERFDL